MIYATITNPYSIGNRSWVDYTLLDDINQSYVVNGSVEVGAWATLDGISAQIAGLVDTANHMASLSSMVGQIINPGGAIPYTPEIVPNPIPDGITNIASDPTPTPDGSTNTPADPAVPSDGDMSTPGL